MLTRLDAAIGTQRVQPMTNQALAEPIELGPHSHHPARPVQSRGCHVLQRRGSHAKVRACRHVLRDARVGVQRCSKPRFGSTGRTEWHPTSVDIDGSSQQLRISGSGQGRYGTVLFDDSASQACGGAPARFVGSGSADGTTLQMTGTVVCLPGGNVLGSRITLSFVYSPTTDTLTDESGVVWYRS